MKELDRAIVAALHLSPRASWELLARALGASESTVARRATRLFETGRVAVVGLVDRPSQGPGIEAVVQLHTRPGQVRELLTTLSSHDRVRFAAAVTGSANVLIEAVAADTEDLLTLLDGLGAIPGINDYSAAIINHRHTGAHAWDPQVLNPEVAEQVRNREELEQPATLDTGDPLTEQEERIVAALGADGRTSVADLAALADTSASTARRRLDSLHERGILHFRTIVEPTILGFGAEYMLWLDVPPAHHSAVAATLAQHPATRYLVSTSGTSSLFGACVLSNHDALPNFLQEAVPTENPANVTTQAVLHTAKRHWRPSTQTDLH